MLALVTEAFGGRGGIAQYNRDLLRALAAFPADLKIEVAPRFTTDVSDAPPQGVRQVRPCAGRARYSAHALVRAWTLRPPIVLCGHLYMAPVAAAAARLARARLVIQLHGVEIWSPPTSLQRYALERADLVLCVSRDTRARTMAAADIAPHRLRVLPNTVADDFVPGNRRAARASFGWTEEQFVLLSVGRLDPRERYKGQDRIIAALPRLHMRRPDVHYVIAGEGNDRLRLEALARDRGVAKAVTFLGHVPRARLPDLYRAADLFCLPSTGEGFGIVYLEAMACGTPAMGLAVAGTSDALADGALGDALDPDRFEHQLEAVVSRVSVEPATLGSTIQHRFGQGAFGTQAARLFGLLTTGNGEPVRVEAFR